MSQNVFSIITSLRRASGPIEVGDVLLTIQTFSAVGDINRRKLAAGGCIALICSAMRKYASDSGVQGVGCGVLGDLANHNQENRIEITRVHGIEIGRASCRERVLMPV